MRFHTNRKGASVPEFATFASLAFTLSLVLYIALNGTGRGVYPDGKKDQDLLSERIIENCLVRTRANDTVVPRQAKPYNCFKLAEGNDRITVTSGDNIIYPGPGRNVTIAEAGSKETQIVYENGDDIIHLMGGSSTLDMRNFRRDEIKFDIMMKTPSTIEPGQLFDPDNRPAVDLMIKTPVGSVIIADHFANKSLNAIVTKDSKIFDDTIPLEAVSDQITDKNDRILGTGYIDIIAPKNGNDLVLSYEGDDIITYTSGHDRYDPGTGRDILEIPHYESLDVKFEVLKNGNDIKMSFGAEGSIILLDQLIYPPNSDAVQFNSIEFSNESLRSQNIIERAISDQSTPEDDNIIGSRYSDVIKPGLGDDVIAPGGGSDIIFHEGGTDTILQGEDADISKNTLVLEQYTRSEIAFEAGSGGDLILTTPSGSKVIIKHHFSPSSDISSGGIRTFRLKGEDLADDIMRKLFFPQGVGNSDQ